MEAPVPPQNCGMVSLVSLAILVKEVAVVPTPTDLMGNNMSQIKIGCQPLELPSLKA